VIPLAMLGWARSPGHQKAGMGSAFGKDDAPGRPRRLRSIGAALAGLACAAGCTILDPHVPTPDIEVPNLFLNQKGNGPSTASPYDFAAFKSKYLTELVALGRGFNFDVGAAIARIQEAEAQVRNDRGNRRK
jgi:hypothetical protein